MTHAPSLSPRRVTLGLGGNIGDRETYLQRAAALLEETLFIETPAYSRVYETPALLKEGAPPSWNLPYLNAAVSGYTLLSPHQALDVTQATEKKLGKRLRGEWAPREIDIDMLLYDTISVNTERLRLPHPHIFSRAFVLYPLADIFPDSVFSRALRRRNAPPEPHIRCESALFQEKIGIM